MLRCANAQKLSRLQAAQDRIQCGFRNFDKRCHVLDDAVSVGFLVFDGMSEEEAVASLGDPARIVKEILAQTPFAKLVKNKVRPKHKLQVWETLLICIGAPVWVSLIISVAAAIFSVFVSLWACIVAIWATEISLVASGVGLTVGCVVFMGTGAWYQGVLVLGGGLVCVGLSYFGWRLCKCLTVLFAKVNKAFWLFVKSLFVKKEGSE